jgi:predicted RNase H-like HicB family nuclease
MKTAYWARFFKESDGKYSVDIPDLPGCFTCGPSVEAAYRQLVDEAIPLWLEDQPWPPAREADDILALPPGEGPRPPLLVRVSSGDVGGLSSGPWSAARADGGEDGRRWGGH